MAAAHAGNRVSQPERRPQPPAPTPRPPKTARRSFDTVSPECGAFRSRRKPTPALVLANEPTTGGRRSRQTAGIEKPRCSPNLLVLADEPADSAWCGAHASRVPFTRVFTTIRGFELPSSHLSWPTERSPQGQAVAGRRSRHAGRVAPFSRSTRGELAWRN